MTFIREIAFFEKSIALIFNYGNIFNNGKKVFPTPQPISNNTVSLFFNYYNYFII